MRTAAPLLALLLACHQPKPPASAAGAGPRTPCALPSDPTAVLPAEAADEPPRPLSNARLGDLPASYLGACARGHLVARFVIDPAGRVRRGTVEIIESRVDPREPLPMRAPALDPTEYERLVRRYLASERFAPAVCQGRPVASRVEHRWEFRACS